MLATNNLRWKKQQRDLFAISDDAESTTGSARRGEGRPFLASSSMLSKHNRDRLHDNGIRNVMDLATESLMRNDSDSNSQSKETKDALKWAKKAKAMIAPTLKSTVKRLTLHQAGTIFRQKKGLPSPM